MHIHLSFNPSSFYKRNEPYLYSSVLRFSFVTCFLFSDSSLHFVAAAILVLFVCMFLFSTYIICFLLYI
jgi:thiosulfate reductase cytochrome b subunit